MSAVSRGDVWWYEPPHEGRRPYVIVHRDAAIPVLNQVLAVPITRTRRGLPTEVDLDRSDGMPESCVATLDNFRQVEPAYLSRRITVLGPERMAEVCAALHIAVGC